jgi:hydrogenase maturation protein HypF
MAENEVPLQSRVIGVAFDGTGYGKDGTVWGGEFLVAGYTEFKRKYYLRTFRLPGGDKAVKEPYRVAVSLLLESGIDPKKVLPVDGKRISFVEHMVKKGVNSPLTSSMGRLFDGVAAILGIRKTVTYQAQAAILLEQRALRFSTEKAYHFDIADGKIDWRPVVEQIVKDKAFLPVEEIARKFHNSVAKMVIEVTLRIREETGLETVALSGGVFQNKLLTEVLYRALKERGFKVLLHQIVPPNDGGISLGQAVYGGLI